MHKESSYQNAKCCHRQGQWNKAKELYRSALIEAPTDARILHDFGVLYFQLKEYSLALKYFSQAARNDPLMAEALFHKGSTLTMMQRQNEALVFYKEAVRLRPDYFDAHFNLGACYNYLGELDKASRHFQAALALKPDCYETLNALGVNELNKGAYENASAFFSNALNRKPNYVQSLYNLSLVYKRKGLADRAIPLVRKALQQKPDFEPGVALLVSLLRQTCAWDELEQLEKKLDQMTKRQLSCAVRTTESPFLSFTRKTDPDHNYQVAETWGKDVQKKGAAKKRWTHRTASRQDSKITIGYLSEQFRDAATSHLMVALFEKHNRRHFRINAYSLGKNDHSWYRRKIMQDVDHFFDIRSMTAEEGARLIYDNGVDILVDLSGWMHGHRIMIPAMRPAPIQVNYLGYPGTTGAAFMDYILADRTVIPPDHHPFYSEKVVYLPHCYQVTDPNPPVNRGGLTRAACGLPDNSVVYCSFCTDYKIDRQIFRAWLEILAAVPGSVLWLLVRSKATADNLRRGAGETGIAPERLIFAPALPKAQHLERLALADLALDTAIVNGHTTTTDALGAGVPVLTLQGSHFASRVASSLIRTMGLNVLIKRTLQEYVDFAIHLGLDNRQLTLLKQSVKLNRFHSALFDIHGFTVGLEAAFLRMWEIHLSGEPPHSFAVSNC